MCLCYRPTGGSRLYDVKSKDARFCGVIMIVLVLTDFFLCNAALFSDSLQLNKINYKHVVLKSILKVKRVSEINGIVFLCILIIFKNKKISS